MRWSDYLYLLPALLAYVSVVIVPLFQSAWLSLHHWNGVGVARWAGLANYGSFLRDPELGNALSNVLTLVVFYALLPIALGLLSATLVSRHALRGAGFFRSVIFLPQIISSVVMAIVWRRLYAPDGLINEALRGVGLDSWARSWLGDTDTALPALGVVGTWAGFGFCMVLFVAGIQSVSPELYDAVRVDGGGAIREFFTVTLPSLRPHLAVALTLTVVGALRAFDLIWLTTRGGPGTSTLTPGILLYRRAFVSPDVGAAAAIGILMLAVSLVITWVIVRLVEDRS